MKVYRTVAMNYIKLCTYKGAVEGASSCCSNVECDNRVVTNLPRRTSVQVKTGKKLSACGLGRELASAVGNVNNEAITASAQKLVRRCDRKRF